MGLPTLDLSAYLTDSRVIRFTETPSKVALFQRLTDALLSSGVIEDEPAFRQALIDRENVTSTGIGRGIAIPHVRLSTIRDFAIAVGVVPHGVDYGSADGVPVSIIVMIASPEDARSFHLHMLAAVVSRLSQEDYRNRLLAATDARAILDIFAH